MTNRMEISRLILLVSHSILPPNLFFFFTQYTKAPLESPSLNFPLQVYTPRQINVNHTNAETTRILLE